LESELKSAQEKIEESERIIKNQNEKIKDKEQVSTEFSKLIYQEIADIKENKTRNLLQSIRISNKNSYLGGDQQMSNSLKQHLSKFKDSKCVKISKSSSTSLVHDHEETKSNEDSDSFLSSELKVYFDENNDDEKMVELIQKDQDGTKPDQNDAVEELHELKPAQVGKNVPLDEEQVLAQEELYMKASQSLLRSCMHNEIQFS
jgi:hypothetical protein